MEDLIKLLILFLEYYQLYLKYNDYERRTNGRRWWVRPLNLERNVKVYFVSTYLKMMEVDPEQFFLHTRMTKPVYALLFNLIKDDLTKQSNRQSITAECRLAVTLSALSQGVGTNFLAWSYQMGRETVRSIILETCEIIWKVLSPVYVAKPIEADYRLISKEFWEKWNMPNCVGAIDGKHIELQAPPSSGSSFFNYKKTFSIVLLATCDANYTFTDISVGAYGSQSDGRILRHSSFGEYLMPGNLPIPRPSRLPNSEIIFPHYFVADAAIPIHENIMRPYPGRTLPADRDIFNYRLSRARRVIENSFGILVARWRVLKQPLQMLPNNAETIVLATIALHNFIKLNDPTNKYIPVNFADWEDENHVIHTGEWRRETPNIRSTRLGANNARRTAFQLRDTLKDYLCNEGAVAFQYNRR